MQLRARPFPGRKVHSNAALQVSAFDAATRVVSQVVVGTQRLAEDVNNTATHTVAEAFVAVETIAEVVETGVTAIEGMRDIIGDDAKSAISSVEKLADALQRQLARNQGRVDAFQDKMEQGVKVIMMQLRDSEGRVSEALAEVINCTNELSSRKQNETTLNPLQSVQESLGTTKLMGTGSMIQQFQNALLDDCLSMAEAALAVSEYPGHWQETNWRAAFQGADQDKDGCISKDEWAQGVEPFLSRQRSERRAVMLLEQRATLHSKVQLAALEESLWSKSAGGEGSVCERASAAILAANRTTASFLGRFNAVNESLSGYLEEAVMLASNMLEDVNRTVQEAVSGLKSSVLTKSSLAPITDAANSALATPVDAEHSIPEVHASVALQLFQLRQGADTVFEHLLSNLRFVAEAACTKGPSRGHSE